MIWTAMLWLAMTRQAPIDCPPDGRPDCVNQLMRLSAPAEHVFEIRTKRTTVAAKSTSHKIDNSSCSHAKYEDCGHYGCMPDGQYVCGGGWCQSYCVVDDDKVETIYSCAPQAKLDGSKCVHVTRELWLDGKRLGIIKGLD